MKKPIHKHIAHHVKRYHSHFTKYLYERDTIFATLWVFIFIMAVKFMPISLHLFDPMKEALKDFDFNDIAYSQLDVSKKDSLDRNIVVINIGEADREGLALIIEKTASMNPKVIGLDATLEGPRDPYKDSLLGAVISRTKNLVIPSRLDWHDHHDPYKRSYFKDGVAHEGYVNMLADELSTVRLWSPFFEREDHQKPYQSFAASILELYDSAAFKALIKRHKTYEVIHYTRKITPETKQYRLIELDDLLMDRVDPSYVKGKIALLGYINLDESNIEDKKFTPMNPKFAGKTIPDMSGTIVHANMLTMALEHNYINKLPSWVYIIVAVFVGWLHMSFFIRYYLENHIWFHLIAKIAQLISAVFFVYLGIFFYHRLSIQINMSLTLVVIVLSVDIIYFYEAFAVWMHKKFGYKTVFHQQHH